LQLLLLLLLLKWTLRSLTAVPANQPPQPLTLPTTTPTQELLLERWI
jgi:hypothetical protein